MQGTITGISGSWSSGLATLLVDGKPVYADNGPLMRALDAAFPGFIGVNHTVDPQVVIGKRIDYSTDEWGMLSDFDTLD